jgi:hypothetical protein
MNRSDRLVKPLTCYTVVPAPAGGWPFDDCNQMRQMLADLDRMFLFVSLERGDDVQLHVTWPDGRVQKFKCVEIP